jgi:hypothetical protein
MEGAWLRTQLSSRQASAIWGPNSRSIAPTRCFSAVAFEASCKQMHILNTMSHRPKFSCPLMTGSIMQEKYYSIVWRRAKNLYEKTTFELSEQLIFHKQSFAALLRISWRPAFRRRNKIMSFRKKLQNFF